MYRELLFFFHFFLYYIKFDCYCWLENKGYTILYFVHFKFTINTLVRVYIPHCEYVQCPCNLNCMYDDFKWRICLNKRIYMYWHSPIIQHSKLWFLFFISFVLFLTEIIFFFFRIFSKFVGRFSINKRKTIKQYTSTSPTRKILLNWKKIKLLNSHRYLVLHKMLRRKKMNSKIIDILYDHVGWN